MEDPEFKMEEPELETEEAESKQSPNKSNKVLIAISLGWVVLLIWLGVKIFNNSTHKAPPLNNPNLTRQEKNLPYASQPQDKNASQAEAPIPVRALKVKRANFSDYLPLLGTIKGEKEVIIKPQINGIIKAINFKEGDKIKKGDVIATLDSAEARIRVQQMQHKLDSAQASYQAILKRQQIYEHLYKIGAIIKMRLEEVQLKVKSAALELKTIADGLNLAKKDLEKTVLSAPVSGIMGERKAEIGEFVTPQDEIAKILKIDNVWAEAGVIERDIPKIKRWQRVRVHVDAYPNLVFAGRIIKIFPLVEGSTRTLTIQARIPNQEHLLLPGMFARIEVVLASLKNALMVPTSSIITKKDGYYLPVILPQSLQKSQDGVEIGTVQLKRVKLGYRASDYTQILDGISDGAIIVLQSKGKIKDMAHVRIESLDKSL